jgi:hypothetical protein
MPFVKDARPFIQRAFKEHFARVVMEGITFELKASFPTI